MKKYFFSFFLLLFVLGNTVPLLAVAKTPSDPKYKHWSFTDIGAYQAWDITTGSKEIVVAIIDNGFDANHPDLKDNVWKNINEIAGNEIDDDDNGYIDDISGWNFIGTDLNADGKLKGEDELKGNNNPVPDVSHLSKTQRQDGFFNHGTLVAGIIGAVGNNKKDMAGLNWKIRLMNLKVLSNSGEGNEVALTRALSYAIDNGADIINISAVGTDSKELRKVIATAYEKGVVIVAAAGNNGESLKSNPLFPACSDAGSKVQKVLGVSAIDEAHRLASFSNYGSDCVDITAPGVNMASLMRYEPDEGLNTSYKDGWNGTSFSTPLVSGAAALIKSVQPSWKAPQIYDALLKNTHKTPPSDNVAYKNMFGAGLLQVDKAVEYALEQGRLSSSLKNVALFDEESGSFYTINSSKQVTTSSYSFLRKLTGFDAFGAGQNRKFLTLRPFQGKTQLTIYNNKWERLERSTFSLDRAEGIFLGVLEEDKNLLFMNPNSGNTVFQLVSFAGKKIKEASLEVSGVLIGVNVISVSGTDKKDIAVISKDQNKYFLTIFSDQLLKKETLTLPSVGTGVSIDRGDIDGDGSLDYIFLSQKGTNATVSILSAKAKLIRQFPISSTVKAQDVEFVVGDFTGDLKGDIITIEKGENKVRIWKNTGEILHTIQFPLNPNQTFSLIPLY